MEFRSEAEFHKGGENIKGSHILLFDTQAYTESRDHHPCQVASDRMYEENYTHNWIRYLAYSFVDKNQTGIRISDCTKCVYIYVYALKRNVIIR